ncbi:MAG: dihydrodipicolinate synthase family protein [Anaerotruncus sp.]|jgi:4-hydroxy-tetrahydrodipicolinate synthase|nr:dihydrodipicolinate synthase family protein [Anaerotruncus sp.]
MNTEFIKGVIVPILMPIDKEEMIHIPKLREMVNYVISGGVHGILLFGSNGEFFAMEPEELEQATEVVLDEVNGRVPVYIGVGAITTRRCIKIARMAAEKGAQGISLLQPMFLAPNETELFDHYKAVAQAVPNLPVLIYNNPRVGYGISPALGARMNQEIPNIVGIKDSSGNMSVLAEYVRLTQGTGFKVLAGKDTMIFSALAQGAVGCVATTANFLPAYVVDIYNLYQAGDWEGAREAQFRLTPVRNALDLASFPVGTKDIANLMGLNVGAPYLPNQSSKGAVLEKMRAILMQEGVL